MTVALTHTGSYPFIFSAHDGVVNSCTEFDVQTSSPSFIFDLSDLTPLSYVIMEYEDLTAADSIDVYALDAS